MKKKRYQIGRFNGRYYVVDTRNMKFVYGPFTRRASAASRLSKLETRIKSHKSRTNPGVKRRLKNPRGTVIYGRVLRIEAQKTQHHQCDPKCKAAGHRYFHDFKGGSNATLYGMPDRSLKIVGKG